MVTSQTYTTVTSANTATITGTYTQTSAYAIATTTITATSTDKIYNKTIVASAQGIGYCHITEYQKFEAHATDNIRISFVASQSVSFYILSDDQWKAYVGSGPKYCDPKDSGSSYLLAAPLTPSYTQQWTPGKDGTYWLLLETYSDPDTKVSLSLTRQYVQVVTSVIQGTTVNQLLITATRTATTMSTGTVAPSLGVAFDPTAMIGIVVVIVILIVGFVVYRSRSKSKKQEN
jgi:hypothetical protein